MEREIKEKWKKYRDTMGKMDKVCKGCGGLMPHYKGKWCCGSCFDRSIRDKKTASRKII